MKLHLWLLILVWLVSPAFAIYQVGDTVTNMCWTDANSSRVCVDDYKPFVKVLLYNTGWCPDCNDEMKELAPRANEYDGRTVVFFSLSAQGFTSGSQPDATFLKAWKDKYQIPFPVLASPGDAGKQFGQSYIPNVAILDANDKLAYKAVAPDISTLFTQINQVLAAE